MLCSSFRLCLPPLFLLFLTQSERHAHSNYASSVRNEILYRTLRESFEVLFASRNTLTQVLLHEVNNERVNYNSNISWLDHTDAWMQQYYQQSASETVNIEMGWVRANPHCNSISPNQPSVDCAFHKIVDQFKVGNCNISVDNLLGDQLANLEAMTLLTVSLFNAALYHQAQALAMFLRTSVIPQFTATSNPNNTEMVLQIEKSKLTCFVVQFEIMRERNLFLEFGSIAEHLLYQSVIVEGLDHGHYHQIYCLRYALAIPSMPMRTATSMTLRKHTIATLQHLSRYFKDANVSLSTGDFVKEVVSATPFHMAHQGLNDLDFQLELGHTFLTLCPGLMYTADSIQPYLSSLLDHRESDEDVILRLGFVSAHFFSHSIGRVMIDTLLELNQVTANITPQYGDDHYSKTKITFEVYLYFIDTSSSTNGREDDVTKQYESIFGSRYLRIQSGNLSYLRQTIINDHIDFLMYTDLGMEIHSYLSAFSRLAPVQAMWWGHPITSGLSSIDYFFSLDVEVPNAAWEQYSEQLVRFEFINTIPCITDEWDGGLETNVEAVHGRALLSGLGLPNDALLVSVLGRLFKIHPDFIDMLASLLLKMHSFDKEDRVFLVLFAERTFDFNQLLFDALSETIARKSLNESMIAAVMRRVKLYHFGKFYHQLLPITRIVLDTYPYGGCISSHDAFYYTVPIVSLPSDLIR